MSNASKPIKRVLIRTRLESVANIWIIGLEFQYTLSVETDDNFSNKQALTSNDGIVVTNRHIIQL